MRSIVFRNETPWKEFYKSNNSLKMLSNFFFCYAMLKKCHLSPFWTFSDPFQFLFSFSQPIKVEIIIQFLR